MEMADVKQEVEDQGGFEENQEQDYFWGPGTIKEETEMVVVKEELMLDDDLDENLEVEDQQPMDEIPMMVEELDHGQCLDLSFKRLENLTKKILNHIIF